MLRSKPVARYASVRDTLRKALSYLALPRRHSRFSGYDGRFESWEAAADHGAGYADPQIAQVVATGARAVVAGTAAHERDSRIFSEIEHSFPVATALLWAANISSDGLQVLDFGGGLGTSYFQNLPFLSSVRNLRWTIVEQQVFVEHGRDIFRNHPTLRFSERLDDCLLSRYDVAVISSSLQYVKFPYDVLRKILESRINILVFDRTVFSPEDHDYIVRQYVDKTIFPAVLPLWVFSRQRFINFVSSKYELITEFDSYKSTAYLDRRRSNMSELGFIFRLRDA
jgi:putative methyltransferase (TIGR04325 family)